LGRNEISPPKFTPNSPRADFAAYGDLSGKYCGAAASIVYLRLTFGFWLERLYSCRGVGLRVIFSAAGRDGERTNNKKCPAAVAAILSAP
jgi:hypothetical protein